jgi:hypothetical protein
MPVQESGATTTPPEASIILKILVASPPMEQPVTNTRGES